MRIINRGLFICYDAEIIRIMSVLPTMWKIASENIIADKVLLLQRYADRLILYILNDMKIMPVPVKERLN
jgi:hypothetical protein